jgi:glutathione S-transferase
MLKIWGRTNSINVQKVMWCVGELGLPHERIDAGMAFGRVNDPDYRALNPNGRVPTIEDDGFVLWESNAIVRYLASKHSAGRMYPTDLQARADADRWMDWQQTTLLGPLGVVFWNLIRTPPDKRDMAAVETARQNTAELWSIVDARLARQPFVAGTELTIADIPLGCCAYRWYAMPIERPKTPNVEAWYGRLQERPAFRQHVMLPVT